MTTYDEFLEELKRNHNMTAKSAIARLHELLKQEDKNLSKDDIYDRILKDLLVIWARETIVKNMPDELKDRERQHSGKKGAEKKKELIVTNIGSVASDMAANNLPDPPKEQESKTFEKMPWQQLTEEEKNQLEASGELEKRVEEDALNTKDGIINDQKLEIDKLKEMLTEQKKILDETIKSVNAAAQLNKTKNVSVSDSLEFKALESQIYVLQQENKELKQIAQMQMKQNPSDTFKPASEIPSKYTDSPSLLGTGGRFEIEFPAKELSTLWADARIARQVMYLKIEGNKVVGWESDAQRAKNQAREAAKPA